MEKVRYAIIGCGGIAHAFHLPEMTQIPETEFIVACDLREGRARLTADRFGARAWTTDYREVLERSDVDAVIVATYHPTHAAIGCEVLEADKHVLVQKPLATRLEDANRLVETAERSEKKTYCLPFLWTPEFEMAQEMIASGELGKIIQIRMRVAHTGPEGYYSDTQRIFGEEPEPCAFFLKDVSEVGALFDMGVYSISALTALGGSALRVTGIVKTLDKEAEVEDTASVLLELESGAMGVAETTWCQATAGEEMAVYGTEGTVYIDRARQSLRVFMKRPREGWFEPAVPRAEKAASHQHFVDCILEDRTPKATPGHARHVVEIMLAAAASWRERKWVCVETRMPGTGG
jgi:UDP-N-acetylglucosamine 3-dehydrogenase